MRLPTHRPLLGLALLSTFAMGATATAAPFPAGPSPLPPGAPSPIGPIPTNDGLLGTATVSPRDLFDAGVSMDLVRPLRVESSKNRALMTKESQLVLLFKGASSKGYRIDCKFSGNPQVNVMEFSGGAFVRQASSNPAAGVVNHTIQSRAGIRDLKVFIQANGDTDWSECRVAPV